MKQPFLPSPTPEDWIGVFDSGLGGLAIVREIMDLLPEEKLFYFGDTLHMPYGTRGLEDVCALSLRITEHLITLPTKVIVIACNTASAAALATLRKTFPGKLFIGMEPAVKPAALNSISGKVGVLATPATFEGEPFKRLQDNFGRSAEIIPQPCPGLADAIETFGPASAEVATLLEKFIYPLLPTGIDHLVLGCTHYSLAESAIRTCAGPEVRIVDPSPAIAKRVRQVLMESDLCAVAKKGTAHFQVSGDADVFSLAASRLLGKQIRAEHFDFSQECFPITQNERLVETYVYRHQ